jgi:hypothetical protein
VIRSAIWGMIRHGVRCGFIPPLYSGLFSQVSSEDWLSSPSSATWTLRNAGTPPCRFTVSCGLRCSSIGLNAGIERILLLSYRGKSGLLLRHTQRQLSLVSISWWRRRISSTAWAIPCQKMYDSSKPWRRSLTTFDDTPLRTPTRTIPMARHIGKSGLAPDYGSSEDPSARPSTPGIGIPRVHASTRRRLVKQTHGPANRRARRRRLGSGLSIFPDNSLRP